ncbi:MAG: hypothetical protein KatS3mg056_2350 [Chloroflexus sp.]|nr:MAG: hypothetical protein KatS3mg056_2350 [Chloroflexus sp.]
MIALWIDRIALNFLAGELKAGYALRRVVDVYQSVLQQGIAKA